MTRHFIAYQNRDTNGPFHRDAADRKAKCDGFNTVKNFRRETLEGQRIWVFEGSGSPKRYTLVSSGIITDLQNRNRPSWPNKPNHISFDVDAGREPTQVTHLAWFKKLLRQQRSFFNGFSSLKDKAIIRSLEGLSFDTVRIPDRVDLLKILRHLPEKTGSASRRVSTTSRRRQWIDWVSQHQHQDARFIFNHLENSAMIIWIAEASGVEQQLIRKAAKIGSVRNNRAAQAAAVRRILPWSLVATYLEKVDLSGAPSDDIKDILKDPKIRSETTTIERLIDARLGMGQFRSALRRRWNNQCAVTGCAIPEILRASHIKPWSLSNNRERLNPANGILLAAHIDALFDRGLISFSDSGAMLLSDKISAQDRKMLRLPAKLRLNLREPEKRFLYEHRKRFAR